MTSPHPRTVFGYADLPALPSRITGDEKYSNAGFSTLDVVRVHDYRVLRVSSHTIQDPGRDRFYLSKGHGPMAYYPILVAHDFFAAEWLDSWNSFDSPLGYHADLQPGPLARNSPGDQRLP